MKQISLCLHVYFEDPFWVGVFEMIENHQLQVSRMVFGQEPQNEDILQMMAFKYSCLQWSPSVAVQQKHVRMNPKRLQRLAKQQMHSQGIGTKSQQALKLQQEKRKQSQKAKKKADEALQIQQKFKLMQHKKKEKHKGH